MHNRSKILFAGNKFSLWKRLICGERAVEKAIFIVFYFHFFKFQMTIVKNLKGNHVFFLMDSKDSYASAGIYLLKVNNRSTRTRCEICSKLPIKTPYFTPCSSVSMINFEQVITGWDNSTTSKIFLIYKLLTLKRQPFSIFFFFLKFVWKGILFLYFSKWRKYYNFTFDDTFKMKCFMLI